MKPVLVCSVDRAFVCTLLYLKKGIEMDQQSIHVDSTTLFFRDWWLSKNGLITCLTASSMNLHYPLLIYSKTEQCEVLQCIVEKSTDYFLEEKITERCKIHSVLCFTILEVAVTHNASVADQGMGLVHCFNKRP